jgi:hypothetical protein
MFNYLKAFNNHVNFHSKNLLTVYAVLKCHQNRGDLESEIKKSRSGLFLSFLKKRAILTVETESKSKKKDNTRYSPMQTV